MNAPETLYPQVAKILPYEARETLRRAAATDAPDWNPMARQIAVDRAIEKVKLQFPQFFRKEH